MSRLGQLFKYAKSSASPALENFSTEALASAIRADAGPWLTALRRRQLVPERPIKGKAVVHTQVRKNLDGAALYLDLIVDFPRAPEIPSMWVEVKVYAGEHGEQLAQYKKLAESLTPAAQVITLARSLEVKPGIKGVTWRDLSEAIDDASDVYWRELRAFMNEKRMVLHSEDPITDTDITALESTLQTLDKMTERLHRFTSQAAKRSAPMQFQQNRGSIQRILGTQLGRHQRLCLPSSGGVPSLLVGLRWFGEGPKKEARLMLCVEHSPKNTKLRQQLLRIADDNGLPATWTRDELTWPGLLKSAPITSENGSLCGSEAWWSEALDELERAKILEVVSGASPQGPDDESESDDDDS